MIEREQVRDEKKNQNPIKEYKKAGGREGMEAKKSKKGFVLGEAVRDKSSGQKMYVY